MHLSTYKAMFWLPNGMIAKKLLVCGKFLLHIQEFKIPISQGLVALLHHGITMPIADVAASNCECFEYFMMFHNF